MNNSTPNNGFTLIEFLLYIGLIGILLTVSGAIALNVLFGKAKIGATLEVSQNARFVMERLVSDIRNADIIDTPAQGATSTNLLAIEKITGNIDFQLVNGILERKKGMESSVDLISSDVAITELEFHNISYSNTPGTIRIKMTMKFVNPENRQEYNVEKTFYTTVNIRKNDELF